MVRMAFPVMALVVVAGCSGRDATGPTSSSLSARAIPAAGASAANDADVQDDADVAESSRSGALHMTKNCSAYTRLAGSFCTITSSNVKQLPVGTRVIYQLDAGATGLDTDVILDPPSPGKSVAFGHVMLDFPTARGVGTLSGGTGKFRKLHAHFAISHLTGRNWAWDGTYSFDDEDGDD